MTVHATYVNMTPSMPVTNKENATAVAQETLRVFYATACYFYSTLWCLLSSGPMSSPAV